MNMNKKLTIGNVEFRTPFFLAPLAGITDGPFRKICGEMGAGLVYSEMVSAKGLWYKDKNTGSLLQILEGEAPAAYQLFGHEPEIMAHAARTLDGCENVIFDINMGCPVPKIVKNGEGSALMKNPGLAYDVIKAAADNTYKPVTVKIRAGWDDHTINAVEIAKAAEAAGAKAVAVHGRTREQFYSGRARWDVIADVKRAVNIPVIGNGDVTDVESARQMMVQTGCDFIMIGRGALGNPWIFSALAHAWQDGVFSEVPTQSAEQLRQYDIIVTKEEKRNMMLRHFEDTAALKGEYVAVREMRKHVGWYLKGVPGAAAFRGRINQIDDAEALQEAIRNI